MDAVFRSAFDAEDNLFLSLEAQVELVIVDEISVIHDLPLSSSSEIQMGSV